jgi:hypothetical protein
MSISSSLLLGSRLLSDDTLREDAIRNWTRALEFHVWSCWLHSLRGDLVAAEEGRLLCLEAAQQQQGLISVYLFTGVAEG